MFATIETNGATHIAIHIPKEGSDKTLPAIAAMLEHNAVFIRKNWHELAIVKPVMGITLGDTFKAEQDGMELVLAVAGEVLGDEFVPATPEVFISMKAAIKKRDDENTRLRNELTATKDQLAALRERIAAEADREEA